MTKVETLLETGNVIHPISMGIVQQAIQSLHITLLGSLVEFGATEQVFSMPKDKRTEDYITGRFG